MWSSFLDRVNISFAALRMNQDLGFSPEVYGFASGVFFFGYFLFEVPSNLMLQKVGARLWMCRICVSWGLLSMLTAFCREPVSFCIVRFLLGAAEAGLYPGMVLYMTYWFPSATRARFIALFLAGVPLANVIGSPISSCAAGRERPWPCRLAMDDPAGRHSVAALRFGDPVGVARRSGEGEMADAEDEKRVIAARLAAEPKGALHGLRELLADRRIWILMIPDFSIVFPLYALNFFLPQMVHGMGYSIRETGIHRGAALSSGDGRDGGAGLVQRQERQSRRPCRLRRLRGARLGVLGAMTAAANWLRDRIAVPGDQRHLCGAGGVLDLAGLAVARHRGGGRAGAAQQLLQPGRFLRPHRDGLGEAADRDLCTRSWLYRGHPGAGRRVGDRDRTSLFLST